MRLKSAEGKDIASQIELTCSIPYAPSFSIQNRVYTRGAHARGSEFDPPGRRHARQRSPQLPGRNQLSEQTASRPTLGLFLARHPPAWVSQLPQN